MSNGALLLGIAGTLIGTATGAVINARASSATERRREARVDREEAAKLRAAARLVSLDLATASGNLAWAVNAGTWHPDKVRMPTDAWDTYRDRLAMGLEDNSGWFTLSVTMGTLTHLSATTAALRTTPGDLTPAFAATLTEARNRVREALIVLAPIAGLPDDVTAARAP